MKYKLTLVATILALLIPTVSAAQSVEEVLARFDAEPTIIEVQEAAAAYAQIDEAVMDRWSARANAAAILPDLTVEYRRYVDDDIQRDDDQDLNVDENGDLVLADMERDIRTEDDEEQRLIIQGDFELNELIWNPDLLRISKERRDLVELREDVLTSVTSLYFERRRAQVQLLLNPPTDTVERLRRELEIQELTASIDALTGGWFSEQLSASGLPTY